MKEIEVKKETLNELLNGNEYRYKIPYFQRSYVWKAENARELMDDFAKDTNNFSADPLTLSGYLLGNIVIIEDENKKIRQVIDGQQRITTLTLLFRILYLKYENYISKKNMPSRHDYGVIAKLLTGYTHADLDGTEYSNKLFHDESLNFGYTYKSLLTDNADFEFSTDGTDFNSNVDQAYLDEDETMSDKNIRTVYEALSDYVDSLSIEQLKKLIYYLEKKVNFIVTKAPNMSKAFQLFEILNNRGIGLEPVDLIKNFMLKKLDELKAPSEKQTEFKENWIKFLDNLHFNKRSSISESQFLKHYIIGTQGENKKIEELYDTVAYELFEESTVEEILEFSRDLKKKSNTYTKIAYKSDNDYTDDLNKLKYLVDTLGIKQLFFLLIPFYNESATVKEEVLDLAIRLGSSVLFSFTQTNFIEREIPILIKSYLNQSKTEKITAYSDLKSNLNRIIKERAEIAKESIRTRRFEKSSSLKATDKAEQILKFIEYFGLDNESVLNNKLNNQKISVEHIFAINFRSSDYSAFGFADQGDYINNLNRIGNLTLLLLSPNISGSNDTPEEKKMFYKESDFNISNKLVNDISYSVQSGERKEKVDLFNTYFTSWFTSDRPFNKSSIEQRSTEIANFVYRLLTQ